MKIVRCNASHDAQWNDFVRRSPRGSFYHRVEVVSTNPEVKIEHPKGYYYR